MASADGAAVGRGAWCPVGTAEAAKAGAPIRVGMAARAAMATRRFKWFLLAIGVVVDTDRRGAPGGERVNRPAPGATRAATFRWGYLSTVGFLGQPFFFCQALTAATADFWPFARQESRYGQG